MNRSRHAFRIIAGLGVTLLVINCGGASGPGNNAGSLQCKNLVIPNPPMTSFCDAKPTDPLCTQPICGNPSAPSPLGSDLRVVPFGNCKCNSGDRSRNEIGPSIDFGAQYATDSSSDKPDACKAQSAGFVYVDAADCAQLGFVNAFNSGGPAALVGGQTHDGDELWDVCPMQDGTNAPQMGVQAPGSNGVESQLTLDLRSAEQIASGQNPNYTGLHNENAWCRLYGGPVAVSAGDNSHHEVTFCEFRPDGPGQRVSMVGDWVSEGPHPSSGAVTPHAELHEVRLMTVVKSDRSLMGGSCALQAIASGDGTGKVPFLHISVPSGNQITCDDPTNPDCLQNLNPNTWHLLTSGFFGENTAQESHLGIIVPLPPPVIVPPATTAPGTPKPQVPTLSFGGCPGSDRGYIVNPPSCVGGPSPACHLSIDLGNGQKSKYSCASIDSDICPCSNGEIFHTPDCEPVSLDPTGTITFTQDGVAKTLDRCDPAPGTHIAYAGDIRVDWDDPGDLWQCQCECDDPAAPGATITAMVQGCADEGFDDSERLDRIRACQQACGGSICGNAPACRIGSCHALTTDTPSSHIVAEGVCDGLSAPAVRVTPGGDYRFDLDPTSTLSVGSFDSNGNFNADQTTGLIGSVWANIPPGNATVEVADLETLVNDFTISKLGGIVNISVKHGATFLGNREVGAVEPSGGFEIPQGQVIGGEADVNGVETEMDVPTGGPQFLGLDLANKHLTLQGSGQDGQGHAVAFQLSATMVDGPPTAVADPDREIECQSPTTTPVVLDGSASFDSDAFDSVEHYQWFEGDVGLGNQAVVTTQATLGRHGYTLHVYDGKLGSDMRTEEVTIVHKQPPSLTVKPASVCLWPPNHTFALFRLGEEIQYEVSDKCDPNPKVWIDSVQSDEPELTPGSGHTSPDVVSGTQAACVRSEREGMVGGRTYTVTVKAENFGCQVTTQVVQVFVPHDMSGNPGCQRAIGLDTPDDRCTAGAPKVQCVPRGN